MSQIIDSSGCVSISVFCLAPCCFPSNRPNVSSLFVITYHQKINIMCKINFSLSNWVPKEFAAKYLWHWLVWWWLILRYPSNLFCLVYDFLQCLYLLQLVTFFRSLQKPHTSELNPLYNIFLLCYCTFIPKCQNTKVLDPCDIIHHILLIT